MNKNQPSIEQLEATNKAYTLRQQAQNDNELAEQLGMSKVTLYTRLKKSNWKKPELALIESLSSSD
jgi:DNA-binding NtrC family response regulator